ncbi:helix-turn-helix transcriptional regulator [Streptomyces sp. SL13]|jgi:transcriptional regulator with XRE-family HTH domain|uniref:Helix-turn-helix transcriptional regulator n=1 Tax=Streptantibioticus silvisoli TaxID=2705255 RepID=A0AA90H5Y9_9ACTN|nr:helix-turn-helix transcriptional regulator [Streptantibioticus silvisoli]MDI5971588.1 helix-turn-helix transcriptional regulator [Streptantibioticus silvisoli]
MSVSSGGEPCAGGPALRLRTLFDGVHPAGRGPWTARETAEATGVPACLVNRLCAGTATADDDQLAALARHFRVPEDYLTSDGAEHRAWRRTARRLTLLFSDIYPAGRGPWTHEEVARASGVPVEDVRRMCAGAPTAGDTFAARLDQLCLRISPVTGRPYSNREVGAAVGKSGQYIGNLRAGVNEPGLPVATELAKFFDVSVSYFVNGPIALVAGHFRVAEVYLTADDDSPAVREIEDSLRTLIALRDERVQQVVGRVLDMRWPN